MTSLRLLTVNAADSSHDRAGLPRLIERSHADLVCVHGAPSLLRWRSLCAALARQAGMVVVRGGRTSGGTLLLSTLGVDAPVTAELTFDGSRGLRPAGAALAQLALLGSAFTVGGARLGVDADQHVAQVRQLRSRLAALAVADLPAVLAVDGAPEESPAWQALSADLVAVAGGVFVDGRIGVAGADYVADTAVVVELTLP